MKPLVLTLVWNRVDHVKWCFKQLHKFLGPRRNYNWLVVDNYSTDGAREWIQKTEKDYDKVVYMDYNVGMVHGRNRGIAEREKGQDVLNLQADQDFQGAINIVECLKILKERIRIQFPNERLGALSGDYANWHDGRLLHGPNHFKGFEGDEGDTAWSKKDRPPKMSQPIDQHGMLMTSEMLDEVGYFCEMTCQSDLEFPYRAANAGFVHYGSRALLWNLERYHGVGTVPVSAVKGARSYRRNRGLMMWGMLRFDDWVTKNVYGKEKQCYRGSIWDSESIEKWNPVIEAPYHHEHCFEGAPPPGNTSPHQYYIPKDFKETYEGWSRANLKFFLETCQDDSISLEEMEDTPTQKPPERKAE